jgi:hypothetical protein
MNGKMEGKIMNVTGYKLREALKMKSLELATIQSLFDESLYAFEGEKKDSPEVVAARIGVLETQIAVLQAAQSYYNLQVTVEPDGNKMPLEAAVKMVGGAGRLSKMWRTAAQGSKRDRWDRSMSPVRNKEDVIAQPTISKSDALVFAQKAEKFAAALRSTIAVGNNNVVAIDWIDESLF